MAIKSWLWLLLGVSAATVSFFYASRVEGPWRYQQNVVHGELKAELGDLYSRWIGTRELLLHGQNPYGPAVSHEIQLGFYGRDVSHQYAPRSHTPLDEQRFAYPVFVVFLLAPTVHLSFAQVQLLALVLLTASTAASVGIWMQVLDWRASATLYAAITLLVISSPQVVQGLRLRQLGLLVAFLLAIVIFCVTKGKLAVAGSLLALATIKPQMIALPAVFLLIWMGANIRKRWPFVASFALGLAALVGAGELVLPGWLRDFASGVVAYRTYTYRDTQLEVILGTRIGLFSDAILLLAVLAVIWRNRHMPADSLQFLHVLSLVLCVNTIATPLFFPFNQVLLLLPLFLLIRNWTILPPPGRIALWLVLGWPPLTSLVLLAVYRGNDLGPLTLLPSYVALLLPVILLVLLACNWSRWAWDGLMGAQHHGSV